MNQICTAPYCDRPALDAWICRSCEKGLEHDLTEISMLWRELAVTLTRQDVLGGDGGRRSAEVALVFKPNASEARWVLANTIGTWARLLAESHSLQAPLHPARWLLLNVHSLAMHEAAGEAVDEIRTVVRLAYRTIDRPPEFMLAGVCEAAVDDGRCVAQLYARPGDTSTMCEACGAVHEVAERREAMILAASGLLVTATVALGWVKLLMDKTIPQGTWDSWKSRGRVLAHGISAEGYPTYRFGEVRDLALTWVSRKVKVA